jgi:uncharacterized protein YjbJ (UPF0337 family)
MANEDEAKGVVQNIKGRVKQAAGAVTGNKRVEAEGTAERIGGAAQEAVGKAKRKLQEDPDDEIDE